MRKLVCISLFLIGVISYSQSPYSPINGSQKVIIENYTTVKGSEFIYNKWNKGVIVLYDSIFSVQEAIGYDAYKQRLLLKLKGENEAIEIDDNLVTGFAFFDSNSGLKHDFVKLNSNNFEYVTQQGFFEIVYNLENKNYLIKKNEKILFDPNKSKGVEAINNLPLEFQDKTTYFIKNDKGSYVEVRLRKKDIKAVLKKHPNLLNTYITNRKVSFSKESDVVNLINYYYSL